MTTCPECGYASDDAAEFTAKYCPSWPDRCSGCEIHEDRLECPDCGHRWEPTVIPSRYALDDSGPVNPRHVREQEPFTCSICQREITRYSSAAWNSSTCDRCLPPNENPELARIERMNANDRRREELAREKGVTA